MVYVIDVAWLEEAARCIVIARVVTTLREHGQRRPRRP
jgi:hypothetical protein